MKALSLVFKEAFSATKLGMYQKYTTEIEVKQPSAVRRHAKQLFDKWEANNEDATGEPVGYLVHDFQTWIPKSYIPLPSAWKKQALKDAA